MGGLDMERVYRVRDGQANDVPFGLIPPVRYNWRVTLTICEWRTARLTLNTENSRIAAGATLSWIFRRMAVTAVLRNGTIWQLPICVPRTKVVHLPLGSRPSTAKRRTARPCGCPHAG